jgi:hypothetical protein
MLACWAPQVLPWLLLIGALVLALRHAAFGECRACKTKRKPKCVCPGGSPDSPIFKDPDWRKRD